MRPKGTAAELERRRRRAVELVEQGEPPSVVARILGVRPSCLHRWRRMARRPQGLDARPVPALRPGSPTITSVSSNASSCKGPTSTAGPTNGGPPTASPDRSARASASPITPKLFRLAATGGLRPADRIWPEGVDPTAAVLAEGALTFPATVRSKTTHLAPTDASLPEWVRALTDAGLDVRALESLASPPASDWLDDVRNLEQTRAARKPADDDGAPAPWPVSQDYNEAVQSPATNFADADLRTGQAVTNALGIPQPCSGNFADVYQMGRPDGLRWAVKCFTREATGLRERYHHIS